MAGEDNGLPEEGTAVEGDKLSQIINQAMEPPAETSEETTQESADRVRDERGRFAAKETAEASEGTADAQAKAVEQPADPAAPQEPPIEAPRNFTAEQKATFAALPREAQEVIANVEKTREAEYTRRNQDAAERQRAAEPFLTLAQQHQQDFAQMGLRPDQAFANFVQLHRALLNGPIEQKLQLAAQALAPYGIDLAALSRGEAGQVSPTDLQLRHQIAQLQQRLDQREQAEEQQSQQQIHSQIEAFANAKDTNGQAKYPHYQRVRPIMGELFRTGEAQTLEDAYGKAVAIINEGVSEQLKQHQQTAEQANRAAVDKAKRAAPVRSSATIPGGGVVKGLDNLLDKTLTDAGYQ